MDFSHSSAAATAGLSTSALGFSERSLSSLTSDLTDNHHRGRMPSHHNMPPTSVGSMSPGLNPLKQCRSEMDMDGREDRRGPLKLARTDSFSCRQADLKMHMSTGSPGASLVRSNSVVSDGRLGCSPTNSCASDGGLLGSDATVVSDSRQLMRSDSVVSAPAYPGSQRSPLSYHHQTYHYKPAGSPLSMGREAVGHMSMQNIAGARAPFTSGQWAELEHQALIFKYMMAGVNVPPDLLNPIRKSVAALSGLSASHHVNNLQWGTFHLGVASNADPEPGRCRRTDGKKWRCSRDVVPDQKYCERHMHRGRHRSRKPTDGQSTTTSPAATAASSPANSSSVTTRGPLAGSGGGGGGGSSHSLSPTMSANSQQQQQHSTLGMKSFGNSQSNSGSGAISIGSPGGSNSSGSFQLPLQSPPGGSAMANKDFRYMNGMSNNSTKSEMGMGPEQLLFSETSGSARGLGGQESPSMSNLSRLSSVNHSWQALSAKVPPAPQPKSQQAGNNSNSLLHYQSPQMPQMRSLLGQDFGLMPENNQVNISMAQQQHSFLGNGYGGVEAVSVVREPEGQPLRHFFDDWPRSRDPTALAWSDVEEDRPNRSNASTTQLSISIPVTSSDFPTSNASPSRGKLTLSPLKLSMSRARDDDRLGSADPTHMGLGMGMGLGMSTEDRHRQTTWIPIAWENPLGGPLAEVLSTPRGGCKSSGLNLLCDGWDSSPRDSPRMASPTGVLQKANFGSFSDSSSSGSSPRTIKSESTVGGLPDWDDRDDDEYHGPPYSPWAR